MCTAGTLSTLPPSNPLYAPLTLPAAVCAPIYRYRARLTTKEVEKVLPLLTHDQDLRHKATRLF